MSVVPGEGTKHSRSIWTLQEWTGLWSTVLDKMSVCDKMCVSKLDYNMHIGWDECQQRRSQSQKYSTIGYVNMKKAQEKIRAQKIIDKAMKRKSNSMQKHNMVLSCPHCLLTFKKSKAIHLHLKSDHPSVHNVEIKNNQTSIQCKFSFCWQVLTGQNIDNFFEPQLIKNVQCTICLKYFCNRISKYS